MSLRACGVALVLLSVPMGQPAAVAQVLTPPARPPEVAPASGQPPRVRHELTMEGSVVGGYDDNLAPPTGGSTLGQYPSGYTGFADETVRYRVGDDARSMEVNGRAYMNTYRNAGVGPSYGGEQHVRFRTTLGRRTRLEAGQGASYRPYFFLGLFVPIQSAGVPDGPDGAAGAGDLDARPTNALAKSSSWTHDMSASLSRQWTRKTKMDLDYSFNKQTYVNSASFDTRSHASSLAFEQAVNRTSGIRLGYHGSRSMFAQQDGSLIPNLSQTADVGFYYRHRLSRTRQISLAGGAGAMHTDTLEPATREPLQYWGPSGYGNFVLQVGRSWNIGADYRRSTTVLQGIGPHAFVSDVGTVNAGGLLQRRVEAVITAGYANGVTGQAAPDEGLGRYNGYTGTVQLRFELARGWSSVVIADHFHYRLNEEASRSLGVSTDMHRNTLRVGFSWLLPLYRSRAAQTEPSSGSRN